MMMISIHAFAYHHRSFHCFYWRRPRFQRHWKVDRHRMKSFVLGLQQHPPGQVLSTVSRGRYLTTQWEFTSDFHKQFFQSSILLLVASYPFRRSHLDPPHNCWRRPFSSTCLGSSHINTRRLMEPFDELSTAVKYYSALRNGSPVGEAGRHSHRLMQGPLIVGSMTRSLSLSTVLSTFPDTICDSRSHWLFWRETKKW